MTAFIAAIEPDRVRVATDGLTTNIHTSVTGTVSKSKARLVPMHDGVTTGYGNVWLADWFAWSLNMKGDREALEETVERVHHEMKPEAIRWEHRVRANGGEPEETSQVIAGWSARQAQFIAYLWRAFPGERVELQELQHGLWLSPMLGMDYPQAVVDDAIDWLPMLAAQRQEMEGRGRPIVGGEAVLWEVRRGEAHMYRLGPVPETSEFDPMDLEAATILKNTGLPYDRAAREEQRRKARAQKEGADHG